MAVPAWVFVVSLLFYIWLAILIGYVVYLLVRGYLRREDELPVPRTDPDYPVKRGPR